ncbi:MAG TPA: Ig domain-containing protein [Thermoanaerobaculia bacterium]|nr:Ig domain-containing protein [Thermoanaerobaculia bacterium]
MPFFTVAGADPKVVIQSGSANPLGPPTGFVILPPSTLLPLATTAVPYKQVFTAKGGTPPYRFEVVVAQALPPGLHLSADGVLSGTPSKQGRFNFSVTAHDSAGATAEPQVYTIVVG